MNKKMIIILIVACLTLALSGLIIYNGLTNYAYVLKVNWQIELPSNSSLKEIYHSSTGESFHGDGIRYHVFSYKNEETIRKTFTWLSKDDLKSATYQEKINKWLLELEVSKEYYPNYVNCLYWYKTKADKSEIIMLLDSEKQELYIVENFL